MDSTPLKTTATKLMGKLDHLPQDMQEVLRPLLQRTLQRQQRRQELLADAMRALSDLRLHMKYLLFDLEATRRENIELKERLGEA